MTEKESIDKRKFNCKGENFKKVNRLKPKARLNCRVIVNCERVSTGHFAPIHRLIREFGNILSAQTLNSFCVYLSYKFESTASREFASRIKIIRILRKYVGSAVTLIERLVKETRL